MAVKLRLTRVGKTKQPQYRIVAADARSPRDGRFIEILGQYNPREEPSLINVDNDEVKELANGADYYAMATIPGGMYNGTPDDITTFGVGATFVASTKTSPEVVYQITKAVFDNFARFKKMHPAFGNLVEADMIKNNLSAPLHEGAVKYYKEKGWM